MQEICPVAYMGTRAISPAASRPSASAPRCRNSGGEAVGDLVSEAKH
jgi:hypothetical protein